MRPLLIVWPRQMTQISESVCRCLVGGLPWGSFTKIYLFNLSVVVNIYTLRVLCLGSFCLRGCSSVFVVVRGCILMFIGIYLINFFLAVQCIILFDIVETSCGMQCALFSELRGLHSWRLISSRFSFNISYVFFGSRRNLSCISFREFRAVKFFYRRLLVCKLVLIVLNISPIFSLIGIEIWKTVESASAQPIQPKGVFLGTVYRS